MSPAQDASAANSGGGTSVVPDIDSTQIPSGSGEVSEQSMRILDFERQWWKYAGMKEQAIKELFGLSSTRYYQTLNQIINDPTSLSYDPMLVKRLRRMRDQRQKTRTARRLGFDPKAE